MKVLCLMTPLLETSSFSRRGLLLHSCSIVCDDPNHEKIREGPIDVSLLELCGTLVFKLMINIVLDIEDIALRSMSQSFQTLRIKDVPGGNVATSVS